MAETVLQALAETLKKAAVWNRNVSLRPAAVLWTDEARQWAPLLPRLRAQLPALVTLGGHAPENLTGPSIWIRAVLARQLEGAAWPAEAIPVLYLPGVSRSRLRAIETCEPELKAIAELQYRGVFFSHPNGRDWTVHAFLKSAEGLGLDVAEDKATLEAMHRTLGVLADTPLEALRKGRLEAADFNRLLRPEPERDLLRWLNDPQTVRASWGDDHWKAFCDICRTGYGFDPNREGELGGADRLMRHAGAWAPVWQRFAEAPKNYPGVVALLFKTHPNELPLDGDPNASPHYNSRAERTLRLGLLGLADMRPDEARQAVFALEAQHGSRRHGPWAELGHAPLAVALEHLMFVATGSGAPISGPDAEAMASQYAQGLWEIDDAAAKSLAAVSRTEDVEAVKVALRAVYVPWLEASAERLQALVKRDGYPGAVNGESAEDGGILFFVDGLRFDAGRRLQIALSSMGLGVDVTMRWTAIPSVTATGKTAVSPVTSRLVGTVSGEDFAPTLKDGDRGDGGKALTPDRFRGLLKEAGYQVLTREEVARVGTRGWAEHGNIDRLGHDEGWRLVRRLDEQVRDIAERIATLLEAGWTSVKVVTDHGWLLVPGGMPKVELDGVLAETRWGRCAVLKSSATDSNRLVLNWGWSDSVRIAMPPGISAYKAGMEYSHGGLSLQESVTPVLVVRTKQAPSHAKIESVEWVQMRCRVSVSGVEAGFAIDLRTSPADPSASVLSEVKALTVSDGKAKVSVLVGDDDLLGDPVSVVVLDPGGVVVAKRATTVGGD